ncbi:hypothetical protein DYB35_007390 [Aphanomyces astaci]|uniref:Ubiquitin-like domain-containing protein n=1 Tax=Aphanomyces astaci TaxID=112090 RepID=A0A418DGC0_APHAT|nr:hypothetical protein DYB35_007390 [Aphanomyces astaci]
MRRQRDPSNRFLHDTLNQGMPKHLNLAQSKSKTIKLFVKFDDDDMAFKVKRSAYLQKIFDNFANVKGVPVETLRFFYDGARLKGDITVQSLGLDSDSRIDCFSEQVGGHVPLHGTTLDSTDQMKSTWSYLGLFYSAGMLQQVEVEVRVKALRLFPRKRHEEDGGNGRAKEDEEHVGVVAVE